MGNIDVIAQLENWVAPQKISISPKSDDTVNRPNAFFPNERLSNVCCERRMFKGVRRFDLDRAPNLT